MATYVGTTNPTTGEPASPGNGWWFGGQFSGGEPVYYQGPQPGGSSGGGSTGGGSTGGGSTGGSSSSSSSGIFSAEEEKRRQEAEAAAGGSGLFTAFDPLAYGDLLGRLTFNDFDSGYDWWQDGGSSLPGPTRPATMDELFGFDYSGRGLNFNPAYSSGIRSSLHDIAQQLGLPPEAADQAALENQRQHLQQFGREYIEVDHPYNVADDIARRLFALAGQDYTGLAPEQRAQYDQEGIWNLERAKNADEGGGMFGGSGGFADLGNFLQNHLENQWSAWEDDPERAVLGINTPLESEAWGEVLDKDYESTMNMYGGPTEEDYRTAAAKGIDTSGMSVIQPAIETAVNMYVGGRFSGPNAPAWAQSTAGQAGVQAGRAAFTAANSQDSGAMKQAILMQLLQQGIDISAPYVNQMIDEMIRRWQETGNVGPMQLADAGMLSGVATDATAPMMPPAITDAGLGGAMPAAIPAADPTFGGMLTEQAPGVFSAASSVSAMPPAQPASDPTFDGELQETEPGVYEPSAATTTSSGVNYTKIAQALAKLLTGSDTEEAPPPPDAPTQEDAEDDAHFAEELATYLSLDPKVMAESGLEPGTEEYHEYIMQQADSVIQQVLGDIDPNAADLADQLRAKTQDELLALQRALYVRGQLATMMGSGTYTDPATGLSQEVVGEGMFNPAVGAYEQGLAGSVDELAGLEGQDASDYLSNLLNRDVDFFGMQKAQNERFEQARRTEREEDELRRRRRGMFSY